MTNVENIQVQYVNPRNGNRPPSIKDSAGNIYTVPDPAIGMFQQGAQGQIGFYLNQRGYRVATHWNGAELPKGQRGPQPMQQVGQALPPVQRPAPPAAQNDIPPILSNVLAHAIDKGASPEALPQWANWTREAIKTFQGLTPPPPPMDGPVDDMDDGWPGP